LVFCNHAGAGVFVHWNFNSVSHDTDPATGTLAPAIGNGSAMLVGGVTASFTASNGSSDPNPADNSNWRVTTWPSQGLQNRQNGIQFQVSTAGRHNIKLFWDLRASNTASKYARLQYSTNGVDFLNSSVIVMPSETWINRQSASFVGVPGVDNNPIFAVRFVTEFEFTAINSGVNGYVPSNPTSTYGNNGTLRFDMVSFSDDTPLPQLTVMSYNVLGNGATNFTLTSTNVEAIGRELAYLRPDVVGFQEVPETFYAQWATFIFNYLPEYYVVTGQHTDGGERSAVASRFPILRSQSWLARSNLVEFGYNGVFTRDLFEAVLDLPGFAQPFHFFTVHLKAHADQDSAERRGAEARAVSNFFANAYLSTNQLQPYLLVGDMNEDINRPRTYEQQAIQHLTSTETGLRLTTPRNPLTNDERTWSIQNPNLTIRFDYVLPCGLLFSNITGSQVFRSDAVIPAVPPMQPGDSAAASDHIPVLMTFRNPYSEPFRILAAERTSQLVKLHWQTIPGGRYRIESTAQLAGQFSVLVTNLVAQSNEISFQFASPSQASFFRVARE
jgi:endonuclease/exonuclease/phosphatase family metal-dependent hydrolase